jgi:PAS domain S-box-containing protein
MVPNDDNDVGSLEEAIDRALQSLSLAAVDSLLQKEGWLREFVSFIEDLPFCITVASATELGIHDQRYPLIYVNEAFENLTQYARKELIGQNCRLLQSDSVSELHQIELMRSALHEKRAIRLAITNVRKDGSTFLNFLGMKPIINRFGEYTHVLGVQYKLEGHEETCSEDFVAGNDLLRLLPSLFY